MHSLISDGLLSLIWRTKSERIGLCLVPLEPHSKTHDIFCVRLSGRLCGGFLWMNKYQLYQFSNFTSALLFRSQM